MHEIIALWTLRYGPDDTLREVARGLIDAASGYSTWTEEGKRYMYDAGARAQRRAAAFGAAAGGDVAHIANLLAKKMHDADASAEADVRAKS